MSIPKRPIVRDIDELSDEEPIDSSSLGDEKIETTRLSLAAELHSLSDYSGINTTSHQRDLFDEEIDVRQSVENATAEAARVRFKWANKRLKNCEKQANELLSRHAYLNNTGGFLGLNIRNVLNEAQRLKQEVKESVSCDKQLVQRYIKKVDILEKSLKATGDLFGVSTSVVRVFADKFMGPHIQGNEEEKSNKIDDIAVSTTSLFFHFMSFVYNKKTGAQ